MMKISRQRFEELISLYLDKEASEEELRLLSVCVRNNRDMAQIFHRACRIHSATCRLYGREAKFTEIKGVNPLGIRKMVSGRRIVGEWMGVAALMMLSFCLFTVAMESDLPRERELHASATAEYEGEPEFKASMSSNVSYTLGENYESVFSLFEFTPKAQKSVKE